MDEDAEYSFTGQEHTLTYAIAVPQPPPGLYIPLDQQTGRLGFKINGMLVANQSVKAPQMPYGIFEVCSQYEPEVTVARGEWIMLHNSCETLNSAQALFPDTQSHDVLMQFKQMGTFEFNGLTGGTLQRTLKVTVDPYGGSRDTTATIDPAKGGVLWAGATAFEIPPGALPANPGGYAVHLSTSANNLAVQGDVTARSPIQKFSFTPEVTQLNADLILHIPRPSSSLPVMAFYDPITYDPFPIDSAVNSSMPATHVKVTLPAGSYPLPATALKSPTTATNASLAASQPGWFRRGLNWLGTTGLWHAVGLPNDKLVTAHFVLLFNTNDCTNTYAANLLDALESAYAHFDSLGYAMPAEAVYVKIAPWVASSSTPGVTPGIGSLFNFYIFMNNALSLETLQDTAVHEFFHVLQKTNATPDGRYMNPVWWEEATAIWSQYEMYPDHTGYYITDIHADNGQVFMRTPVEEWHSMPVEQMNAAMAIAAYLQEKYGQSAVLTTFTNLQLDWGEQVGVQKSIEMLTGQSFDKFYAEFAQAYWLQKFEPVKSWTFIDSITDINLREMNVVYPLSIDEAVNTIAFGNVPQLSSGMYKIYAAPPADVPPSFNDTLASGSVVRLTQSCTGMAFYFFDGSGNPISDLTFDGASTPPFNEVYYEKRLGQLTLSAPLYMLYMDKSYGYDAACGPAITLEQPTITKVTPNAVVKNRTVELHAEWCRFW